MYNNKFHSSWTIGFYFFGIIIGIALCPIFKLQNTSSGLVVISISFLIVGLINKKIQAVVLAIIAGIILGVFRGSAEINQNSQLGGLIGQSVVIEGRVSEDTSFASSGEQRLKLKDIVVDGYEQPGDIWVSTNDTSQIKRSNLVAVEGLLSNGFGSFSATVYRARIIKVVDDGSDSARQIRDKFSEGVKKQIPEPQSSLGLGFLTGQHTTLPENLNNNLRLLGLTHIIVASGYNLTILVRFARRFFARFSKYAALMSSGFLVYGFILITGFSPSMERAGLVTGLSLLAWYYGRKIHPFVLISISAGTTALINPGFVYGDLGWYLSFLAFIGVIILAPLIKNYFFGPDTKLNPLAQIFIETLSAQVMTAPIIAYAFNQLSLLALPANILVLSFIPFAMLATFIAGVAGLLPVIIAAVAWPGRIVLGYITTVVDKLAVLPIASAEIQFNIGQLIACYALIIVAVIYLKRRTKYKFVNYNIID